MQQSLQANVPPSLGAKNNCQQKLILNSFLGADFFVAHFFAEQIFPPVVVLIIYLFIWW